MKRKKLCLLILAVLLILPCTGCGPKNKMTMADENATEIQDDFAITGSWIIPGSKQELHFSEDGSCEDTKQKMKGTYRFYSGNASFTIADLFDEVHYIACQDKKGKEFFTGAILGDLISGYQENLRRECYYIRSDRESVSVSDLIGNWKDVNGDEYTISLKEDGTVTTTDWEGTYTLSQNENYGSWLTLHFDKDYDEEYAVLKYEKYLFLYRNNTSLVYQLEPME